MANYPCFLTIRRTEVDTQLVIYIAVVDGIKGTSGSDQVMGVKLIEIGGCTVPNMAKYWMFNLIGRRPYTLKLLLCHQLSDHPNPLDVTAASYPRTFQSRSLLYVYCIIYNI